ncbi:MAG: DUF2807 domain-containing protein [Flavobacteriia bacterium]|nr:DUF2807 domain-containing protein [Flavobacteriia bacterium]
MKKSLFIYSFIILSFIGKAQIIEERKVESFHNMEISSGMFVVYEYSETQKVSIETNDKKYLEHLIINVDQKCLKIGAKKLKLAKNDFLKIYIQSPDIYNIEVNSGATLSFTKQLVKSKLTIEVSSGAILKGKLKTTHLTLESSSGASVNLDLVTEYLSLETSSGASVKLSGTAGEIVIESTSGASCNIKELVYTKSTFVKNSGGSIQIKKKKKNS